MVFVICFLKFQETRFRNLGRIKTIKIIVDENPPAEKPSKIRMNKMMPLWVKYGEGHIGEVIRAAGGRWEPNKKLCNCPIRTQLLWDWKPE